MHVDPTCTNRDTSPWVWLDYAEGFPSDEFHSECWYDINKFFFSCAFSFEYSEYGYFAFVQPVPWYLAFTKVYSLSKWRYALFLKRVGMQILLNLNGMKGSSYCRFWGSLFWRFQACCFSQPTLYSFFFGQKYITRSSIVCFLLLHGRYSCFVFINRFFWLSVSVFDWMH